MPYAQIDDRFHAHPKIKRTSLAARGLFVTGLSYAACYLTDGALPPEFADDHVKTRAAKRAADELVERGLWEHDGAGYRIVGYLEHNRSRVQVERDRERARARQAAARDRQRQSSLPWREGAVTP